MRHVGIAIIVGLMVASIAVGAAAGAPETTNATDRGYPVETSGGEQFCVTPVEGAENVSQFYGYKTSAEDSRGGETGFERAETASLLLYEDTTTGNLSLVFLQGSSNESDLRRADYDLSGFEGLEWLVKDDPESFAYDSYEFDNGTITGVNWRWQSGTDGGAVGSLGDSFDLSIDATTQEVDTWRVIDGDGSVAGTAPVGGSVRIATTPEVTPASKISPDAAGLPRNVDCDPAHEDVTGDGRVNVIDVAVLLGEL